MPDLNPEQRMAVLQDGNVIVSAAAGAGKTFVLTERVFRLIQSGVPVDRLLILTFTHAAAEEMKTRISKRLADAAGQEPDDRISAYYRAQAQLCASANISTIHSFCSKVVFRHFFLVGLSPTAKVMEETESKILQSQVRERVLTNTAEEDPELYKILINAFNGEPSLVEILDHLDSFLSAEPDPEKWLQQTEASLTDENAFAAILEEELRLDQRELELAAGELSAIRDRLTPDCSQVISVLDDLLMHARGALMQRTRDDYRSALDGIPTKQSIRFPAVYAESEEKATATSAKSDFNKLVRTQLERYTQTTEQLLGTQEEGAKVITALFELAGRYRSAYAEEKRQKAVLDFNDLEHMTIEILKDDRIAEEYRERFQYIIVDEYQDSNRVQETILSRVAHPDNLFFVGDVKQSIYRFRKAEPSLFLQRCRDFTGTKGTRINLKNNYRSSEAVIGAVNRVFETVMKEEISAIEYDDDARLRRGGSDSGGHVELHLFERVAETDEESITDAEAEARFIAQKIKERIQNDIYEPKQNTMRKADYKDFAILLRTKKNAEVYARTLSYAGIPCYAQFSGGYFEAIEVQLVLNLLRVLDNRRQDIPLLSVLRSPFFGFTDEELIPLRKRSRKGDFLDNLLLARDHNVHVAATLDLIESWALLARQVSLEELLDTVMQHVHFRERMSALPGGTQRAMNLDALVERARMFDATGSGGLHGFLDYMEDAESSGDLGASQTVTSNVVRIMTIHKSKGLEFPVVFLAQLGRQFNTQDEQAKVLLHEQCGIGLSFLDRDGFKQTTYLRRLIKKKISDASWQEELRVLYVGMTRAKTELYLCGSMTKASEKAVKYRDPTLLNIRKCDSAIKLILCSAGGILTPVFHTKGEFEDPLSVQKPDSLPAADPAKVRELSDRFAWRYPYPRTASIPTKTSVTALDSRDLISFPEPRFASAGEDPASIGTRVHAILQRMPLIPYEESVLQSAAASVGEVPEKNLDALRFFLRSPLYGRMLASSRVEREQSFVLPFPANRLFDTESDQPVLLQGVIDACFMENGSWILLDYKTDYVAIDPKEHAKRHFLQLSLYADALESITHIPVREKYVVLLNAKTAVQVP